MADPNFQTGQVFDVGTIVRELTATYPMAKPYPKVSADALAPLIAWLRTVTNEITAQYDKVYQWGVVEDMMPDWAQDNLRNLRGDLHTWQARMGIYEASLAGCKAMGAGADPGCTTWPIVAPLFFGFYDGATGDSPQTVPDLVHPFTIANQLGALRQWSIDQLHWTNGWRDLKTSAAAVAATVNEGVQGTMRALGAAAGAAGGGIAEGLGGALPIIVIAVLLLLFFMSRGKQRVNE